jgi:hypothetical protein
MSSTTELLLDVYLVCGLVRYASSVLLVLFLDWRR